MVAKRLSIFMALLVSASCGFDGDPRIYGVHLVVQDGVPDKAWDTERVRRTIEIGAAHWGIDPWSMAGWRLMVKPAWRSVWCGGFGGNSGCTDPWNHTVTVEVGSYGCIELSALIHEMGHIKFMQWGGDSEHWSPGWWNKKSLAETWDRARNSVPDTYFPDIGEPDCRETLYVNQWGP
jgi:hypothetical protein